jgi:hypothetical protein
MFLCTGDMGNKRGKLTSCGDAPILLFSICNIILYSLCVLW